ncbi:MAG: D-glycero-beta-D-manno-heptose 1,7-bisphosphate 7-phosphatase [Gammaproteobacteria bacterium]
MPATNHDKIVVLDRDGVINQDSPDYIKSADEWLPIPRSIEAIAQLHQAGFLVAVATNQSGLARDYFDAFTLAQIHQKLAMTVEAAGGLVSGIFYCPHGPDDGCTCRKPGVGLLQQIEAELRVSLPGHCFIGDSLRDLQCARDYAMQPVLVLSGNGIKTREQLAENRLGDTPVFADLLDAVQQHILA